MPSLPIDKCLPPASAIYRDKCPSSRAPFYDFTFISLKNEKRSNNDSGELFSVKQVLADNGACDRGTDGELYQPEDMVTPGELAQFVPCQTSVRRGLHWPTCGGRHSGNWSSFPPMLMWFVIVNIRQHCFRIGTNRAATCLLAFQQLVREK